MTGWAFSIKENPADDGVRSAGLRQLDLHAPRHVPNRLLTIMEAGVRLSIENRAINSAQNGDTLRACRRIPIEQMQRNPVRISVGQIHIDREAAGRIIG